MTDKGVRRAVNPFETLDRDHKNDVETARENNPAPLISKDNDSW